MENILKKTWFYLWYKDRISHYHVLSNLLCSWEKAVFYYSGYCCRPEAKVRHVKNVW